MDEDQCSILDALDDPRCVTLKKNQGFDIKKSNSFYLTPYFLEHFDFNHVSNS